MSCEYDRTAKAHALEVAAQLLGDQGASWPGFSEWQVPMMREDGATVAQLKFSIERYVDIL